MDHYQNAINNLILCWNNHMMIKFCLKFQHFAIFVGVFLLAFFVNPQKFFFRAFGAGFSLEKCKLHFSRKRTCIKYAKKMQKKCKFGPGPFMQIYAIYATCISPPLGSMHPIPRMSVRG